jgi:hypothetical protein
MDKKEKYELFRLWVTEFLPKAVGFAGGWDEKKYLYTEIAKCFPDDDPKDLAVTPATEAICAWFLENSSKSWMECFAAKDTRPAFALEKHYNDDKGNAVSAKNSFVRTLQSPVWPKFVFCLP